MINQIRDSPPRDRLVRPIPISPRRRSNHAGPLAQQHLRHAPVPEEHHDGRAPELGERLAEGRADAAPEQVLVGMGVVGGGDGWLFFEAKVGADWVGLGGYGGG